MKRLAWSVILLSSLAWGADSPRWQGTWAATAGGGVAFAGTWDAAPGSTPDAAGGNWTLRDQNGTELATGTWAAGKEGKSWKGVWQARRLSGQVYDGAWRVPAGLPATAHFSQLFEAALAGAMSGNWQMGSAGGAWTIRAYEQK